MLDSTVAGNPTGWTMTQLRSKLPPMLARADYEALALQIDPYLLTQTRTEVETKARAMTLQQRNTGRHNRGTEVIEAGNVRFGLEMRTGALSYCDPLRAARCPSSISRPVCL